MKVWREREERVNRRGHLGVPFGKTPFNLGCNRSDSRQMRGAKSRRCETRRCLSTELRILEESNGCDDGSSLPLHNHPAFNPLVVFLGKACELPP